MWLRVSLAGGVSPETVSEQAGHSSVTFTPDTYAHVLSEEREGASDRLENLICASSRTRQANNSRAQPA